jgi:predicted NAD/FAD-dependent oxidoreductase
MREVVVIGGGPTGLAAVCELERLGINCTLIEVGRRLGGSVESIRRDGFVLDSGPMCHPLADSTGFAAYLERFGLTGDVFSTGPGEIAFTGGTSALVAALEAQMTAPVMARMAVSTLGQMDGGSFAICLENGMLLEACALIVAAPARYAERMLHTLDPHISQHLLDYRYDSIYRLSLGYIDAGDLPLEIPPEAPITEIRRLSHPERVPPGGVLIQAGLRFAAESPPADPLGELTTLLGWPDPAVDHLAHWPQADPVMWRDPDHSGRLQTMRRLLPAGLALAGSDYVPTGAPPRLDERIAQGVEAARQIARYLRRVE